MSGGLLRVFVFCLATGAAMGCLFLLLRVFRIFLCAGKLLTAATDVIFCCVCAVAVFLCALAVDRGRLRLLQVVGQAIGAWAFVTVFEPLFAWAAKRFSRMKSKFHDVLYKRFKVFAGVFCRTTHNCGKSRKKQTKSHKKAKKVLENRPPESI